MDVKTFHMVEGEDEGSYAKNSHYQRLILKEVLKSVAENSIGELVGDIDLVNTNCIKAADLGCSSGPNALLTAQNIIHSIHKAYSSRVRDDDDQEHAIDVQYYFNDLVTNDFNLVFKGLPDLHQELEELTGRKAGSCLFGAVPGTFYGKLFPENNMHFLHSCNCLHWLSKIPSEVVNELRGFPIEERMKGTTSEKGSPPIVRKLLLDQFGADLTTFLGMRSRELVQRGHLLLIFCCEDSEKLDAPHFVDIFASTLAEMVKEGCIEEKTLEGFNMPGFFASVDEIKQIILKVEGPLKIKNLHTLKTPLDAGYEEFIKASADNEKVDRAGYVATYIRAVLQPLLASHFGEAIMDEMFQRYRNNLVHPLESRSAFIHTVVISLRKE